MEHVGAFFDEEWECLSKLFSAETADNFMLQLHDDPGSSIGTLGDHDHREANNNSNFEHFTQESSITSCGNEGMFFTNNPGLQHCNNSPDDHSIDFFVMDNTILENLSAFLDDTGEEMACDQLDNVGVSLQLKRKFEETSLQSSPTEENTKKKSRGSRDANKNKKKAQPKGKTNQKMTQTKEDEETINTTTQNGQSSSCCSSEDDSNALNLSGKSRASRGAATDPQSIYARKRRERINERLKILQNIVPNGTKVDISTMLEEAVNYVKFLQLQIKLLSSDEHWMYAPLAYHGMDIGFYQNMLPNF